MAENHKSKGDKKHKSSAHGEKKRKREHKEDVGHKSKSKKHKSDAAATLSQVLDVPDNISPFHLQTSSLFLPLAPVSQKKPLEGLCAEHLSPLILTYYPPLAGVLLSYHNPRLSEKPFGNDGTEEVLLQNIDEYAVSWAWVTAEFLLFKPEKGAWLEGYVNLANEGHVGIVCWNLFNASIERK
ncbi:DNA-directed RNA polymerase I subunit rpa43, partial [Lachnellula suecica]